MALKNAKAKGARRELRCIKSLEEQGYKCVKAGGSLGAWDVIAVGTLYVRLIQVKSNRWPGRKEMETLTQFKVPTYNVLREVWRYDDGTVKPRIKFFHNGEWVEE